ncbi:MAG: sensor histidine kinase [Allomuricauda sp.]|uniref:Histidine kinase n=1 Tax=Flagellimonas sp. MMG031 TaxID=3158549 RepID=A0AAU7N0P8_9FLAO|nr:MULTISPECIES: histidine kinase [unclassified Allomuricauda]MBO6531643.1 histidine kinase [Allomuricauda sp.]MBO6588232.1 histidine kinase [Allomuricauda sp.]MBO6617857.1 histidine kinase [Allomuricauda sp.]MBO6643132.1 histidine kinase [Allomuricauda sp.]MBO6746192.1 histidine kinase [Allomuricauda sp.]
MISRKELLFQIVLHILVLLFFSFNRNTGAIMVHRAIFLTFYSLATVSVTYYLMPHFLYRKKYWQFFVGAAIVVAVVILIEELVLEPIIFPDSERGRTFPGIYISLLGVLPVMCILSGFKFGWDALKKQAQIDELESTIQESELQFLRSQINPHFLFNNLNNLYSYALQESPKTPEIILEMSGVLRYMLYESKEKLVPLKKELEQLGNFIRLYKLQIEDRGEVHFDVDDIKGDYRIAPLILIVFIENAFKHSQSGQSSDIKIDISVKLKNSYLEFHCRNNYEPGFSLDSVAKGIGLKNVKKRLELLYPKKHILQIEEADNSYHVYLKLELEKV